MPLVAINSSHIRPVHPVVLEVFVERLYAHGAHPLRDQIADRIIRHRRSDCRPHAKTIRKVGRHIELAAADVNLAFGCLAEGYDPRIEPVHQRAQ